VGTTGIERNNNKKKEGRKKKRRGEKLQEKKTKVIITGGGEGSEKRGIEEEKDKQLKSTSTGKRGRGLSYSTSGGKNTNQPIPRGEKISANINRRCSKQIKDVEKKEKKWAG